MVNKVDKIEKVKAFYELYELINIYLVDRDQPVEEEEAKHFFTKVLNYCEILEMDYTAFKKTFGLKEWHDIWRS